MCHRPFFVSCIVAVCVCALASPADAVSLASFDSQTFAGPSNAGAYNFTVADNPNRVLVVGYQHERSATPASQIQTLTYGGAPLTLAIRQLNPTNQEIAEIWYLVNPPTGSSSLSATLDSSTESGRGFRLTALDFFDAAQQAPEATAGSGAGNPSSAAISTAINTLSDDALLLGLTHNQGTASYIPGTDVTELLDISAVSIGAAVGIKPVATAGPTTFDWTQSAANQFNVQAVISLANFVAVPEPASIALWSVLGIGLVGFGCYRARRKK